MNNVFRKTLMMCAIAASMGAASNAMAVNFPDFIVNEIGINGASPNTVTADKITGNFVEVITFSGPGATGTFDVALKWNAGQFVANDGTTPIASQLNSFGTGSGYGMYALYNGRGTFSTNADGTRFMFTEGGLLSLYADAGQDTVLTSPTTGTGNYTVANGSDDVLIATGMPTSGEGSLMPNMSTCGASNGINCGSFGTSSTFSLTDAGSQYFVSPNPFYNISFQSGQLNNFNVSGTQTINGSLDVVFNRGAEVPEPASVALVGLGLAAFAMTRRRRAQQA